MSEATATTTAPAPTSTKEGKHPKAPKSTRPGEPAAEAKKDKPEKILYPGLKPDAEGKATQLLEAWPTDFDAKIHKQLKRHHFKNEAPLLIKRAEEHEKKAKDLRIEAEDAIKTGGKAKGKVKKLRSMMERFAELKTELEKDGVPTDEFVKMFQAAMSGQPTPEAGKETKAA